MLLLGTPSHIDNACDDRQLPLGNVESRYLATYESQAFRAPRRTGTYLRSPSTCRNRFKLRVAPPTGVCPILHAHRNTVRSDSRAARPPARDLRLGRGRSHRLLRAMIRRPVRLHSSGGTSEWTNINPNVAAARGRDGAFRMEVATCVPDIGHERPLEGTRSGRAPPRARSRSAWRMTLWAAARSMLLARPSSRPIRAWQLDRPLRERYTAKREDVHFGACRFATGRYGRRFEDDRDSLFHFPVRRI